MNAKQYLNRTRVTKSQIKRLEEQADNLFLMMLPSAVRYDKDYVQTNAKDLMPEYMAEIEKISKEIKRLKQRYLIEQNEITKAIEKLGDPTEQLILVQRYIREKPFSIIARENHFSESWVYTSHRRGLRHLQEIEMVKRVQ